MGERHTRFAEVARNHRMTPEDRHAQCISLAHGNLPEEMAGEPVELMEATLNQMRAGGLASFLKS